MRSGHLIGAMFCPALSPPAPITAQPEGQNAVDDQRRLAAAKADDGDWIMFGRDFSNQRFAPLQGIDRSNVVRLAPAWVYPLGTWRNRGVTTAGTGWPPRNSKGARPCP